MQKQVIREKQTLAQVEQQVQVMKPLLQAEVRVLRMSQQEFEQKWVYSPSNFPLF